MKNKKIFLILFLIMFAFTNVYAASTTSLSVTFRDGSAGKGKVQYSLNDGGTWSDIENNTNLTNLNVTGNNLRLKIVPRDDNTIDWAGIELNGAVITEDNIKDALQSGDGYSVPANVTDASLNNVEFREGESHDEGGEHASLTISISGDTLNYDNPASNDAIGMFFGINNSQERRGLEKSDVNFTTENNKIVGLTTKNPIDYEYDYNNEGTVTFHIVHQPGDVITSLKINNTSYNTPRTKEALIAAYSNNMISFDVPDVPYQNTYDIVIEGRALTSEEEFLAGFLWTYDANASQYADDDKILHGVLEFVEAKYDGRTYKTVDEVNNAGNLFKWKDTQKGSNDPMGEAVFPVGTVLTLRLIPDAGYQLTSFDLNGFPFEPGEEVGLYTFTVGRGPFHLGAHFTTVDNEVSAKADRVDNGKISNVNFENGTAKLEVDNIGSMSPQREEKFVEAADEYEIDNYLEISLYNTIYKGGKKDDKNNYLTWDTEVNNLDKKARIELELNGNLDGNDVAIVHEKHLENGNVEYEIIDATFDSATNKVSFETDGFSVYAIATKGGSEEPASGDINKTIKDTAGNILTILGDGKFVDGDNLVVEMMDDFSNLDEEDQANLDAIKKVLGSDKELFGALMIYVENGDDTVELPDSNDGYKFVMNLPEEALKDHTNPTMARLLEGDSIKLEKGISIKYNKDDKGYPVKLKNVGIYVLYDDLSKEEENVQTNDGIKNYLALLLISIIGLSILPVKEVIKKYN